MMKIDDEQRDAGEHQQQDVEERQRRLDVGLCLLGDRPARSAPRGRGWPSALVDPVGQLLLAHRAVTLTEHGVDLAGLADERLGGRQVEQREAWRRPASRCRRTRTTPTIVNCLLPPWLTIVTGSPTANLPSLNAVRDRSRLRCAVGGPALGDRPGRQRPGAQARRRRWAVPVRCRAACRPCR